MSNRNRRNSRKGPVKDRGLSSEAKTIGGIGLVLLIGAVLVLVLAEPSSSGDAPAADTGAGERDGAVLVRDDSWKKEAPGEQVTLVEFLDLECEACGAMYPIVERILEEYEGRITFVVRYFPLHQNSLLAAKAAEAAGRQGKYWEMYSMLFENQLQWGEKSSPQTQLFVDYAQRLALDLEAFRNDLEDPALDAKVGRDRSDGIAAGVKGTPSFFVNGKFIGNVMSYEQLKNEIESALG